MGAPFLSGNLRPSRSTPRLAGGRPGAWPPRLLKLYAAATNLTPGRLV